jgi:hypothetical protein
VTALLLTQAMGVVAQPKGSTMTGDTDKGVRVLLHYDIVGAVAHDPRVGLEIVGRADPGAPAQIIKDGVRVYSPERVETFAEAPVFLRTLWRLPGGAVTAQWREIVLHHTGAYLEQRLDVFRWVFLTPTLDRCLPIWVGIAGPPDKLQALGLTAAVRPQDQALADYARGFFRTPAFSHLSYAVIALVTAGLLLLRRDPADVVIAALMFGALAFSASFFFITLACDYRYLYPLDLAAAAGLIYLALEPPLPARWRRTRTSAAGPGGPTLH